MLHDDDRPIGQSGWKSSARDDLIGPGAPDRIAARSGPHKGAGDLMADPLVTGEGPGGVLLYRKHLVSSSVMGINQGASMQLLATEW
jgi:hypothetical protein